MNTGDVLIKMDQLRQILTFLRLGKTPENSTEISILEAELTWILASNHKVETHNQ